MINGKELPENIEDLGSEVCLQLLEWLCNVGEFIASIQGYHTVGEYQATVVDVPVIGGQWSYSKSADGMHQVHFILETGEDEYLDSDIRFYKTDEEIRVYKNRYSIQPLIIATSYVEDILLNNDRR